MSETVIIGSQAPSALAAEYDSDARDTKQESFPRLDGELFPLVAANADVIAPCRWMGGAEVTLSTAMINYYRPMTEDSVGGVIADVLDFLASRVMENEAKNQSNPPVEAEAEKNQEVETEAEVSSDTKKVIIKDHKNPDKTDAKKPSAEETANTKPAVQPEQSQTAIASGKSGLGQTSALVNSEPAVTLAKEPIPVASGPAPAQKTLDSSKPRASVESSRTTEILNDSSNNAVTEEARTKIVMTQPEPAQLLSAERLSNNEAAGAYPGSDKKLDLLALDMLETDGVYPNVEIEEVFYDEAAAGESQLDVAAHHNEQISNDKYLDYESVIAIEQLEETERPPIDQPGYTVSLPLETVAGDLEPAGEFIDQRDSGFTEQLQVPSLESAVQGELEIEATEAVVTMPIGRSENLEAIEPAVAEQLSENLDKIIEVSNELKATASDKDPIAEADAKEVLDELLNRLLATTGIGHSPDMIESLSYLILNSLPQSGTHEIIRKPLFGLSKIKTKAQAGSIGKSALQLLSYDLAA